MPIAASAICVITPPCTTPPPCRCSGPASSSRTTRPGSDSVMRAPIVCIQPAGSAVRRAAALFAFWTVKGRGVSSASFGLWSSVWAPPRSPATPLRHPLVARLLAGQPLAQQDDAVAHPRGVLELQLLGESPHLLLQVAHDGEDVLARDACA